MWGHREALTSWGSHVPAYLPAKILFDSLSTRSLLVWTEHLNIFLSLNSQSFTTEFAIAVLKPSRYNQGLVGESLRNPSKSNQKTPQTNLEQHEVSLLHFFLQGQQEKDHRLFLNMTSYPHIKAREAFSSYNSKRRKSGLNTWAVTCTAYSTRYW